MLGLEEVPLDRVHTKDRKCQGRARNSWQHRSSCGRLAKHKAVALENYDIPVLAWSACGLTLISMGGALSATLSVLSKASFFGEVH